MEGSKAQDPKAHVQQYLEQHNISELMEGLLADLIYNKPTDPRKYIVMQLEKIKVAGTKPLLDNQDLRTMFRMFDVTGKGMVTEKQAQNALKTFLGSRASAAVETANSSSTPLGEDEFVQYMDGVLVAATPFCKGFKDNSSH